MILELSRLAQTSRILNVLPTCMNKESCDFPALVLVLVLVLEEANSYDVAIFVAGSVFAELYKVPTAALPAPEHLQTETHLCCR